MSVTCTIESKQRQAFIDVASVRTLVKRRHNQKQLLVQAVVYMIFMCLYFMCLLEHFRITDSFDMETAMRGYIGENLGSVHSLSEVWEFFETDLYSGVFPDEKW